MSEEAAGDLFRRGCLSESVEAAAQAVRGNPGDAAQRVLLAELLLFVDAFERADAAMAAVEAVEPGAALMVAEFRQLLRAAQARRDVYREGRTPEFLGEPTACQAALLRAMMAIRAADMAEAARAVEAAEEARPVVSFTAGGKVHDDFRDADDLYAGNFEVLTTTGRYFWIPTERIESMEFHPPRRPRDLFWRRCSLVVRGGPDGDVYVPALYDALGADDALRLGRSTAWSDAPPVRGTGQRVFLLGDDGVEIGRLHQLEVA